MLNRKGRKTPTKMKDQYVEVTSMFLVCHALHAVLICFNLKEFLKGIINIRAL